MKLYAIIYNSKKNTEGMGDNKRIIVEYRYGNRLIGEVLLQTTDNGYELCYGDKDDDFGSFPRLLSEGKRQKGETCKHDYGYRKGLSDCALCGAIPDKE